MGTVVKRGDRFRAIVRVTGHPSQSRSFDTEREAKRWMRATETDLETRSTKHPDVTIAYLVDAYLREVAPKRTMAASHAAHDIPSVKTKFGDMRLSQLRGRGLIDWVLQSKLTNSTAHWHIARLTGLLRQAEIAWSTPVPWDDIRAATQKLLDGNYIHPAGERERRVTDAEIAAIKAALRPRVRLNMPDMIDFAVITAMRVGEICRVTWADLDLQGRMLTIRDRKHPTRKFGNHQTIPLLGRSAEILQRQPKQLVRGDKEVDPRIWPHATTYVSKVFHQAALRAGVEDVVFHDLRHEGISRMFEAGFAIPEVALVSGHRDWASLRRYTNLRPGDLHGREAALKRERGDGSPVAPSQPLSPTLENASHEEAPSV